MTRKGWLNGLAVAEAILLISFAIARSYPSEQVIPSELAKGAFRGEGGFSFRVEFAESEILFKRTVPDLPFRGEGMPAWQGESYVLFRVSFGPSARRLSVEQNSWDHQIAAYDVQGGRARAVLSRLTPAVLIDTPSSEIAFENTGPSYLAFVSNGRLVAGHATDVGSSIRLDEPWVLGWFGSFSPYRNYPNVADLDDEHLGADKVSLGKRRPVRLDHPLLFRLEHSPEAIRASAEGIAFQFAERAGKIAIMPLFGGRAFEPAEADKWAQSFPTEVLRQCRLWSGKLRDYPLSVRETYRVDTDSGVLTVRQEFNWESFEDDWKTPQIKAAPVPPMLALALGGNVPVTFHRGAEKVRPVDYNLMDTPGKTMAIEGADVYEYHIEGLGEYLFSKRKTAPLSKETEPLRAKLENHIRQMIDAGHLAPLFYVYGKVAGAAPAYFYWSSSPDLAKAMMAAYPYLSEELQSRVKEYLLNEWKINPPFQVSTAKYLDGANRAPYEVPWQDLKQKVIRGDREWDSLTPAFNREKALRESRFFGDLYGVHAYMDLTGEEPDAAALKAQINKLLSQLLPLHDWALCGPVKPPTRWFAFFDSYAYYRRNDQSTYNSRLAGAIGLVRLAREFGWKEEEALGWYLFGKLAMARVGQARYTAELHRMGLVRGDEKDDWRTLVHIDRECAIILRGSVFSVIREDQEIPPFIDLVEEVGRILAKHAREECRIYLDNLDESMPLWYVSEAPKQSASEQRLCPLQHKSGNVLAQYWILGKTHEEFGLYVDTTRFKGDFFFIENLSALIDSYSRKMD